MSVLKIALLQISPCGDERQNAIKGEKYCRIAKERGADIALFPEMFSCGYNIAYTPREEWKAVAEGGQFLQTFSALAAELEMAVGITFLENAGGEFANTFVLYDRFGKPALRYRKAHTCDFDVERNLVRGEGFEVCNLDTTAGKIKTGAMICFDREFPESARVLMLRGAELILVPNACPMEINRLSQLRARAFENMTAIATCNYPSGVPDCNGHSTVFDGIAWRDEGDMCILEAGEEEGVFCAALDIGKLRAYREEEVHGNAYRRPKLYSDIVGTKTEAPFVRGDARR